MSEEYKTFEKLKEELGNKFEEYMYKANIELLNENTQLKKQLEKMQNEPLTDRRSRIDSVLSNIYRQDKQLQNNWNELKKFVEAKVKHWEEEEKKWIELGFMKFGGEANNKLIFKIVLNKMQELEQGKDE